jgi:SAM-dependent methyltransferase
MKKVIKKIRFVKNIRNYFRTKKIISMSEGQIKANTPPGKLLYNFIEKNDIKNVLEIGTWNGLGSTVLIHDALKGKGGKFSITSLETDKIAYKYAKKNLQNRKGINLILGRITEINEMPEPSSIDFIKHNLNPANIEWFYQDLRRYKKNKNVFESLDSHYDLILFDGGEFSTFAEFEKLYQRTKYFCLDDIDTYKQFEVIKYIHKNSKKFNLIETAEDLSIYQVLN